MAFSLGRRRALEDLLGRDPGDSNQKPWHCCLGRRCPEALALLPRKKESIQRFPLNSFRVQAFKARESVSERRTWRAGTNFQSQMRSESRRHVWCPPFFRAKMLSPWHRSCLKQKSACVQCHSIETQKVVLSQRSKLKSPCATPCRQQISLRP